MMQGLSSGETVPDHEQKRLALSYVQDAWAEGLMEGVDGDCLAQACLFMAFAELVATYGEDASLTSPLFPGLTFRTAAIFRM